MSSPETTSQDEPDARALRVTIAMACLFSTMGMVLTFLPRWLEAERGLSGAEIGAVLSLAQLARILTGAGIAFWADGAADRRMPIRLVALASLGAYAVFLLIADGFWALLIAGFIALTLSQALTPLIEAAALRATAQGNMSYGVARGIGSVSFIFATVAGGALIARFGLGAVVVWILAAFAALCVSAWFGLKPDPARDAARLSNRARAGAAMRLLTSARFVVLIVSCGLIQCAHAFYYGFSTLVWRGQGIGAEIIGLLWGFGVAVEVALLWRLASIERRFSPEALILIGAAGAALRWSVMGFAPIGWVLWPLQALHALSFAATHVGAMRLLTREAPEAAAATAQTFYAALSSGLLMGAAMFLSGMLYDEIGARGYWAMTLIAAAGGFLALLLTRTRGERFG